jgi:putative ABC transport system substrate-binding protein
LGKEKGSGQPAMNRSKQAGMAIKTVVALLVGLALTLVRLAEAQQPKGVPRIGFLRTTSSATFQSRIDAFRQGLRDLGYVEGQNIIVEYRYTEGRQDLTTELAAE